MAPPGISIDKSKLDDLCKRWRITELSLFGSVLRQDFTPDSDVDVLVSFHPDAHWSLFDLMDMNDELSELFGRAVDVVEIDCLRNPFRRRAILSSREVVHAT